MEQEQKFLDEMTGPELLSIPPKLQRLFTDFNKYKIFVIEGGRGSGKTQGVGRIVMYIAQTRIVRVICGREIQATIEESVYTLFVDIINKFNLAYRITKAKIKSLTSGSTIGFKGFRERGAINIKGVEGAHIVWVDEAQALTKPTLDALLPTLRPQDSSAKFIFTMNRLLREDAVMELTNRPDCLHIHIDYFENPFCPPTLLDEAELCRQRSERDYNHIWLGQPMKAGDEYIFDSDYITRAENLQPYGDLIYPGRVMGIDWAAQGNDMCVATILDRQTVEHWKVAQQIKWDEPNATISKGKILGLIADWKPDVLIIDIGGGGWNVYCDLIAADLKTKIYPFDGASTEGIGPRSLNMRADGYWNLKDWIENGWLQIGTGFKDATKQLERLKQKFNPNGLRQVREKKEYKAEHGHSPDEADSLMMAVYACRYIGRDANKNNDGNATGGIKRKSGPSRRV